MSANRLPLRRDTRVFISAVSRELGTVRKLVKKALEDSGYHAVEQDNFPLDYRELVDKLRNQIASCDAVIHIAGCCFGAEPRQRPEGAPRRSYTQACNSGSKRWWMRCAAPSPPMERPTDPSTPTSPST